MLLGCSLLGHPLSGTVGDGLLELLDPLVGIKVLVQRRDLNEHEPPSSSLRLVLPDRSLPGTDPGRTLLDAATLDSVPVQDEHPTVLIVRGDVRSLQLVPRPPFLEGEYELAGFASQVFLVPPLQAVMLAAKLFELSGEREVARRAEFSTELAQFLARESVVAAVFDPNAHAKLLAFERELRRNVIPVELPRVVGSDETTPLRIPTVVEAQDPDSTEKFERSVRSGHH